jgi:hypothetical protein
MTEDTLRTKALTYTRDHLKEIAAYAVAVASTVVTLSIAYGHKQAGSETLVSDVAKLKTDMQTLNSAVATTNVSLARIEGTLNGINMKADEFGKFKDGVQQGAKEALATPVPKLSGRRARHP